MKISAKDVNPNLLSYIQRLQKCRDDAPASGCGKDAVHGDTVMISSRGREIRQAASIAKSSPDVREALVAGIRARIESGTYEVDSEKVAANMIAESLFNEFS